MIDKPLILNKIKSHLNIKYGKDFAEFLGIKESTLSMWYKRETYDIELLFKKCEFLNPEWLLTGKGSMLKEELKAHPTTTGLQAEYEQLKKENEQLKENILLQKEIIDLLKEKLAVFENKTKDPGVEQKKAS
jgi:transcriptional regulator with XRE-family HTH domain